MNAKIKTMSTPWRVALASLAVGAMLAAGCSNSDSGSGDGTSAASTVPTGTSSAEGSEGNTIESTVKDFELTLSPESAAAGEVQFAITNDGPSAHEFVVVKSDLAPDAMTVADGLVSEDGLDVIGEAEDIAPGTSTDLSLELEAGSYVVICNVAGHYEQGMHAGLTVS